MTPPFGTNVSESTLGFKGLISLHSAVFPHEHFVKILLLYENPFIRQFVANSAFQKLQYQSQAGCLKKLGINCTLRKFRVQNTV